MKTSDKVKLAAAGILAWMTFTYLAKTALDKTIDRTIDDTEALAREIVTKGQDAFAAVFDQWLDAGGYAIHEVVQAKDALVYVATLGPERDGVEAMIEWLQTWWNPAAPLPEIPTYEEE